MILFYDYSDGRKKVLQGDGSVTLVIQKHLFAPKGDSNGDWLCTSLFHPIDTIKEKKNTINPPN